MSSRVRGWKSWLLSCSLRLVAISCGTVTTIVIANCLGSHVGLVSGNDGRVYNSSSWSIDCYNGYCWTVYQSAANTRAGEFKPIHGYEESRSAIASLAIRRRKNSTHSKWGTGSVMEQVPSAVLAQTQNLRARQSMLLGSALEGGWNSPFPVGDQGTSFGPFQMHQGGLLDSSGLTPQQAENPSQAVAAMLPYYDNAINQISDKEWNTNPQHAAEQAARIAESPAQDYYAAGRPVAQDWQSVVKVLSGQKSQSGMPPQEANLTSATSGNTSLPGIGSFLSGILNALTGGSLGTGFYSGGLGGSLNFKSDLERIGLVIFGSLLVLVGILVLVAPAASKAAGETRGIQRTVGGFRPSRQDPQDVERRQAIANRSLSLGEQKIALMQQREARLASRRTP